MRWKVKPETKLGTTRIKHKLFLFFPLSLEGETRWFEPVSVKQIYSEVIRTCAHSGDRWASHKWINVEWVD